MKVAVLALLVLGMALATQREFLEFQRKYNKIYQTKAEFDHRFQIFEENMAKAKELTKKNNGSAKFGITKFSDMSHEEFSALYLMSNYTRMNPRPTAKTVFTQKVGAPDPTNYDWSTTGYTTPVYNQQQCGSCWAFSATETIESYWALAGNAISTLSMEQIVDCDTTDQGCNGGNTNTAYQYVQSAGGLDSYNSYPYTAGNGQAGTCAFNSANVVAQISGYQSISGESGLYSQASTAGPVSVCVDASSWSSYQSGVLTSCTSNIDHCVQLTGYANYGQSGAYWIVRNSWGTDWGENGFIWIQIGSDLCAIGDDATIVTI
jgi:C1A family cysteine protease